MSTILPVTASGRRSVASCGWPSGRQLFWAIAFAISLGVGTAVFRHLQVPNAVRYGGPAIPLLAGLFYIRALVDDMRRQKDELQLRIYLEAAAVVVCGLFVVLLTFPILQAAGLVETLNNDIVLGVIVVLGTIGYLNAVRRYR